jgi:hypothetical protein
MAKYTKRWPIALTPRDVARIKEAAELADQKPSEYCRNMLRQAVTRDLAAAPPAPRPPKATHEQRPAA